MWAKVRDGDYTIQADVSTPRCAAHVYSYRNASVGDTRAARRAGVYAASNASATITAAPKTIGAALCTGRHGIRRATKRLPEYAGSAPTIRPADGHAAVYALDGIVLVVHTLEVKWVV